MVLDQIIEQFDRRDRTSQMIVEISVETLTARRFLFAHKNLSHPAMDEVAQRSYKSMEGRASASAVRADCGPSVVELRPPLPEIRPKLKRQWQPIRCDPRFAGRA